MPLDGIDFQMPLDEMSMAEQLVRSGEWDKTIAAMSIREKAITAFSPEFLCRPRQLIKPTEPASIICALAGRGFGKTFMGTHWLRQQLYTYGCHRVAIVGETLAEVNDILVNGPAGIMNTFPPNQRPIWQPQKRLLKFPGGKLCHVLYGDKPKQSRGYGIQAALVDEFAKYVNPKDVLDTLIATGREPRPDGKTPPVLITTTPLPIETLSNLKDRFDDGDKTVKLISGSTMHNAANWPPGAIEQMIKLYGYGSRLYRQEVLGELLLELEGALWKQEMFRPYWPPYKLDEQGLPTRFIDFEALLAEFQRIVVAVDPSGAKDATSDADEIGIVVAGKRKRDGRGVLLEDASCVVGPETWGRIICDLYEKYRADCVVGEVNYGGAMVEYTIRAAGGSRGQKIPYKEVRASRGKVVRAEPIAHLYEKGSVLHLRDRHKVDNLDMKVIEDQMKRTTPKGYMGEGSPDRMDAAVWALSFLMLNDEKRKRSQIFEAVRK